MANPARPLHTAIIHDVRLCWKELALTDIIYKVIAFVLLTPLVGLLARFFIAISGRSVLADEDILFFFLGPVGWGFLVVVGALGIAIVALEQSALMAIACGADAGQRIGAVFALQVAARHAWSVLRVTLRLVAFGLLVAAPFLVAAGVVYLTLLTKYDINYYLTEKPPTFWFAVVLIGGIVAGLVVAIVRIFVGWVFALPLLLFEGVSPSQALRTSRARTRGHGRIISLWLVGWFFAGVFLSAAATAMTGMIGQLVLPHLVESLVILSFAVGGLLILMVAVNLGVTLLSAAALAVLLVRLYRQLGSQGPIDVAEFVRMESRDSRFTLPMPRRLVVAAAVAGVLLATIMGVAVLESLQLQDNAQITAHRGASAAAPENTMAAVERAIKDNTDWVEVDVQETADGEIVVFHDSDFKKIAGVDLKIWDATLADLKEIDIGSSFAPEFSDQRVPTLDQVLQACKGKSRVNIELKYYGHDESLEERVIERVEANGMESDIVIMSLKYEAVRKMRTLRPAWRIGLLTAVAVGNLTKLDADFLAVNVSLATPSFIRDTHRNGKEVHVWTVNDPITMSTMMGRGVDNIITDEPALARSVLRQRAQMSSTERLLVELAEYFGIQTPNTVTRPESEDQAMLPGSNVSSGSFLAHR